MNLTLARKMYWLTSFYICSKKQGVFFAYLAKSSSNRLKLKICLILELHKTVTSIMGGAIWKFPTGIVNWLKK